MVGCDTCCSGEKCDRDTANLEAQESRSAVAALRLFHDAPLHQQLWPALSQLQEQAVRGGSYAVEDHALWKQWQSLGFGPCESCMHILCYCSLRATNSLHIHSTYTSCSCVNSIIYQRNATAHIHTYYIHTYIHEWRCDTFCNIKKSKTLAETYSAYQHKYRTS